jgi:hypothetical protein
MPRRLLARCLPHCIREFRAAARERFDDAISLAAAGRRTGAIYLWGYAAEMTLKAAYFPLVAFGPTQVIGWPDVRTAINRGRGMGIAWPPAGQGHNVNAWVELLVAVRALSPATAYSPVFGRELQRRGQRLQLLWKETLRYHKNLAYAFEVTQVREAAEWLLTHSHLL